MERKLLRDLVNWADSVDRKPLVLLGARQVGKTFLLHQLGEQKFKQILYINFEEEPNLKSIFQGSLNPNNIIMALSANYSVNFTPEDTLIFFDEVQECPEALNSLKYFCEQTPEYYIVAAGSLLGVKLKRSKGFPVGKVDFMHLYPLSFFEFLGGIGENQLLDYLENYNTLDPLPDLLHQKALGLFKIYLYIGGMPEAVKKYCKTKDFLQVREVQKAILRAYEFDFGKHVPSNDIARVTQVWQSMPAQLGKENKKFVYKVARSGARARDYEDAIQWLIDAGLIYRASSISIPNTPLSAYITGDAFKLYVIDTGLLGSMSRLESSSIIQGEEIFKEFKGSLIENAVAIILAKLFDNKLHYWTSGNTAEVDFLWQLEKGIFPIEVKSGSSNKKKSLRIYTDRYNPRYSFRFSPMNLRHDGKLINIPLYLLEKSSDLCKPLNLK
jgi:uncharacterized protein